MKLDPPVVKPVKDTPTPERTAATQRTAFPWLIHEIVFGLFLAITGVRLGAKLGWLHPYALTFFGGLLAGELIRRWARRSATPFRWRVRLLFYPSMMGIAFFLLGVAVPALGPARADALLLKWDRALWGETPSLIYMAWNPAWLNELLMLGYLFFFPYLVLGPATYCLRDLPRFRKCFVGLFTLYGLGLLSYTVFPAGGPHLYLDFAEPLRGPWIIHATLAPINAASNRVDVFPSIHFAVSFYLLIFDWWHNRRRFWWVLVPCVFLWFATVLLRFHYFVDLIGGLAVAVVGLMVAAWHGRKMEPALARGKEG